MSTTHDHLHAPKRPYQPCISTYFHHYPHPQSPIFPQSHSTSHPQPAPIPSTIQSSLLNVGMRIRKAVPSGYHTMPTKPSTTKAGTIALAEGSGNVGFHSKQRGKVEGLVPLCEMHKIGSYDYTGNERGGYDEHWRNSVLGVYDENSDIPDSSQESNISTTSVAMPIRCSLRKRSFDFGDSSDEMSLNCDATSREMDDWQILHRPRLRPKTRVRVHQDADESFGMREVEGQMETEDADFEDAPFLCLPP